MNVKDKFTFKDFDKNQKLTFLSTSIGTSLENMDILFLSFSMSLIIATFHISAAAGGLMITITNIAKLVGGVTFGLLADTYGRVKVFTYTLGLIAIATAAMYFANSMIVIYICRFLVGLGSGGELGVGFTLIAENFKGKKIGSIMSNATSIGQVGIIIAAILAAIILPRFGYRPLFLIGLLPVILVYIVRRHLKENNKFVEMKKEDHYKNASFSKLFDSPKVIYRTIAIAIMAAVMSANYAFMTWVPAIMNKKLGIGTSGSSLLMIGVIIGLMIGMVVFGKLIDRIGLVKTFAIFYVGSALVVYLLKLPFASLPLNPLISIMLVNMLIGFFIGSNSSGFGVMISKLYPMEIRVTANTVINDLGAVIGGGIMPVAIGLLMEKYSLNGVLITLSVISIVGLTVMLTVPGLHVIDRENNKYRLSQLSTERGSYND